MKKEFKKIGFILVASVSLFLTACGGAEEPTTETPAETPTETPVEAPVEAPVETPVDTAAACDAGACEGGACDGAEKPAH